VSDFRRSDRKLTSMPQFAVILPAAGMSSRFGANKLTADLAGEPVISRTIRAFLNRSDVIEVIIATRDRDAIEACLRDAKDGPELLKNAKLRWSAGGESRAHTVRLAAESTISDWLAIHDAARPLVSQPLIDRVFSAARAHGAAAPALPVNLTIKQATGPLPALVERTVPRQYLWAMQTPQAMRRIDLLRAYESNPLSLEQVTDDVQLLELAQIPVMLVPGDEANLKLTTPLDLRIAHELLRTS
jgi:2-C-methyl-D-erythritol 4-phosphate cytidylyltransferase